jgi:hypothetical protein
MAKDHRLDLGRYIDYTKDVFAKKKQLNFDDLFAAKADSGTAPWTPNRFDNTDLLRRIQTRKLRFNPGLQYVGDDAKNLEIFAGIGRFNRREDYDFNIGRALTKQRPEDQPGSNPDPKGYLMATAESKAENEMEGNMSVAELLKGDDKRKPDDKEKEEA